MATAYTQDELRSLFQSSFNLKQWYSFLQHFFNASELKEKPERIIKDTTDEGYYLGNIDTKDHYHVGFFCYNIRKRQFGIITLCNKPAFINDVNIE